MTKTVTKNMLSEEIKNETGIPQNLTEEIISKSFEEMKSVIEEEGYLKLTNFGTFNLKHKNSRPGRNPNTMEPYTIPSRQVVSFNASRKLRAKLNGEEEETSN
jgi:integration host factor subunit alpha